MRNCLWFITRYLLPVFSMIYLSACSQSDDPGNDAEKICSLTVKGASFGTLSDGQESVESLNVYQAADGVIYKTRSITPDGDGRADIPVSGSSTTLYFLAGASAPAEENVTTETEFRETVIESRDGDTSAPDFLWATAEAPKRGGELTVTLKHGVARIDLNTTADARIRVNRLTVENAAAATYPFADSQPTPDNTVSYNKTYSAPFSGKEEGAVFLFPTGEGVSVTVGGVYDDIPFRTVVEIPAVERNRVYEIELLNAGATVNGTFTVEDWEEGGTVTGKPDSDSRIAISRALSTIPHTVEVDYDKNIVSVPEEGAQGMRLAFLADTRIEITGSDGADNGVEIGEMKTTETADGFVSAFEVNVPQQKRGRLGYSVIIHLKNALFSQSYDFVEIRVAPSSSQIETVEIGGSVWMAFNSLSSDSHEQVYPLDGLTVEEMYKKNWVNSVGALFQFGRNYPYIPWQSYNPSNNLGNQTQDVPWVSASHLPCPEGYRIPTREEFESMFPVDATIPGMYVAGNGERIIATLHEAEGTLETPTGIGGRQLYVKFTSMDTRRFLIIPLAGNKGDKSTAADPGFGLRAALWTDSNNGCPGGHALARWMRFEDKTATKITEESLPMEAFASVRCVKIKQ